MTPPEARIFRFFLKESNMKLSTLSLTGLAAMLLVGTATAASALTFDFSFSDDGSLGPFDIPGTVTGEITGLANNATSAATHVYIDTAPSALGLTPPPFGPISEFFNNIRRHLPPASRIRAGTISSRLRNEIDRLSRSFLDDAAGRQTDGLIGSGSQRSLPCAALFIFAKPRSGRLPRPLGESPKCPRRRSRRR
jgi:hypothetical protein